MYTDTSSFGKAVNHYEIVAVLSKVDLSPFSLYPSSKDNYDVKLSKEEWHQSREDNLFHFISNKDDHHLS